MASTRAAIQGSSTCRARVYDPATAQFLTVDPFEAVTGQPYAYALDNPLNVGDLSGLFAWGVIAEGVGVGASCLFGPEVCVPVALGVLDYHVVSADIQSAETGCSPWSGIVPSAVETGVSLLPFGGGFVAKDVWEASTTGFRVGATAGNAAGTAAGAAASSSASTGCGC